MTEPRILRIYLDETMHWRMRQGTFGFGLRVKKAFEDAGWRVELWRNSFDERLKSGARPGYSLFLMDDPFHEKSLTMRKAYFFPFWRIEKTAERWNFDVARKDFDPGAVDAEAARDWFAKWRKWLFKQGPAQAERSGLVYVALQGKLSEHRSFQTMSPFDMVRDTLARAGDRRILLGLHPGEDYSAEDRREIAAFKSDPRVQVQTGDMEEALRVADLVVTQNSAAALSGFFFRKPAVLYAETDFHHQMPRVSKLGAPEAWRRAEEVTPDFERYLYWFIQLNSIKADEDGVAERQIIETCRRHGWVV